MGSRRQHCPPGSRTGWGNAARLRHIRHRRRKVQVVLVDPETFDERPLAAGDQAGAGLGLAREGQDDWAPSGWVVLVPPGSNLGEQGGPLLVNTDDGRVVQLAGPAGG